MRKAAREHNKAAWPHQAESEDSHGRSSWWKCYKQRNCPKIKQNPQKLGKKWAPRRKREPGEGKKEEKWKSTKEKLGGTHQGFIKRKKERSVPGLGGQKAAAGVMCRQRQDEKQPQTYPECDTNKPKEACFPPRRTKVFSGFGFPPSAWLCPVIDFFPACGRFGT